MRKFVLTQVRLFITVCYFSSSNKVNILQKKIWMECFLACCQISPEIVWMEQRQASET